MKGDLPTVGLGSANERVGEQEPNAATEQRDRERLAFAYLTLQAIVQHLRPNRGSRASSGEPPAGTPGAGRPPSSTSMSQVLAGGPEDSRASDLRRISVEMQAGELGRVAIAVDRGPGGVAVELMIENSHAAQLAMMQRGSLLAALESHGMPVASVNVSQGAKSGSTLARPGSSLAETSRPTLAPDSTDDKATLGPRKRLKLMG